MSKLDRTISARFSTLYVYIVNFPRFDKNYIARGESETHLLYQTLVLILLLKTMSTIIIRQYSFIWPWFIDLAVPKSHLYHIHLSNHPFQFSTIFCVIYWHLSVVLCEYFLISLCDVQLKVEEDKIKIFVYRKI